MFHCSAYLGGRCYELNCHRFIVTTLKDNYINKWRSKLENSEKLIFYKEIKTKYEPEGYLSSQTNISLRKELIKLRISNHELMIEKGRYHSPKIPRE